MLYPNPATSTMNVVFNETAKEDMQLQIISPIGQIVKNVRIVSGTQVINQDVSGLPKGIYILKLTDSKEVQSVKLIIM